MHEKYFYPLFMKVKMLLKACFLIVAVLNLASSMQNMDTETKTRSEAVQLMKIVEEQYRLLYQPDLQVKNESYCSCVNYTCGCCVQLVVEKISLNETGCVNVSYLPDEYGFQFLFILNGKAIINETVSVKNPPPICAEIPYVHQLASLCIRFYNLDYKDKQFSGCADIEVELERIVIKKYDLGCFHIPPSHRSILIGANRP